MPSINIISLRKEKIMLTIIIGFLLFRICWKDVDYNNDSLTAAALIILIIFLAGLADLSLISILL